MIKNIRNIDINYIQYGKGKDIVLLHGWGQNLEMMKPIGDNLENKFRITILDLPGFGLSSEPKEEIDIFDYNDILERFLKELDIKNPIIVGHSFGGRIGIIYASKNKTEKLILFGSPCIRHKKKIPLKLKILKSLKKVPILSKLEPIIKKYIGSTDYKNSSEIMRKVLVNTVNIDLSECAKKIKIPTLLIWGENDTEVPIEDAKELESIMLDAGLIIFPNSTHYAYLENLKQVINILNKFL